MRSAWILGILLVSLPAAAADICKDEAKKRLTYLALDATRNNPIREFSEAAITDYRYVVDNARSRLDKRAAYLSCHNLTAMLHYADLLEKRPELLEGCEEKAVSSFLDSLMPKQANSQDGVPDKLTVEGIAPGDWLPIVRVSPVYPKDMLSKGINGLVVVEFTITEDGRVAKPKTIVSSNKKFEKPALRAVHRFRYKPRVIDGKPVESTGVMVTISFSIEGNDAPFTTYPECTAEGPGT